MVALVSNKPNGNDIPVKLEKLAEKTVKTIAKRFV